VSELRLREAARAIVVDPDERILLVRFEFPKRVAEGRRVVWATPGGGVDAGESYEEAIRRELAEEAGFEDADLGPVVWTRTHVFELGIDWDGQRERYFLVRSPRFEPMPQLTWEQLSSEFVTEVRWWTLDELETADASFAPRRLPSLLRRLLEEGPPSGPVDVGV
jgi:ADP-ribose pyrophosphatase YjhB (NUDIX family)